MGSASPASCLNIRQPAVLPPTVLGDLRRQLLRRRSGANSRPISRGGGSGGKLMHVMQGRSEVSLLRSD